MRARTRRGQIREEEEEMVVVVEVVVEVEVVGARSGPD